MSDFYNPAVQRKARRGDGEYMPYSNERPCATSTTQPADAAELGGK